MPVINLDYNLEDVQSDFTALPAGTYDARIESAEITNSQTGKPMLKVVWDITDGEFAGRKLWDNGVLSVGWRVKQYADLIGLESGSALDTDDFRGVEGLVEVVVEEYNGEDRNYIKKVLPA